MSTRKKSHRAPIELFSRLVLAQGGSIFTPTEAMEFQQQLEKVIDESPGDLGMALNVNSNEVLTKLNRCSGLTILQASVSLGNEEAMEMLLPHCPLWGLSIRGKTALILASELGRDKQLNRLIVAAQASASFDDHRSVPNHLTRALNAAVTAGKVQSVEQLLPYADASKCLPRTLIEEKNACNALMRAGIAHNPEILRILLAHGVDSNVRNDQGDTALMITTGNGSVECVRELLAHGNVDIQARNERGQNALMWAAASTSANRTDMLEMLAPLSDLAAVDCEGRTALMHGLLDGWDGIDEKETRLLLTAQVATQADNTGCTPLMHAVKANRIQIESVRALLPYGDASVRDNKGRDALDLAWSRVEAFCKGEEGIGLDTEEGLEILSCVDLLMGHATIERVQSLGQRLVKQRPKEIAEADFWSVMPQLQARMERDALGDTLRMEAMPTDAGEKPEKSKSNRKNVRKPSRL